MNARQDGKVFCIGRNKTGTTSIAMALTNAGYRVGDQSIGERLIYDWADRKFDRIIDFCNSAQAFQDIPFSLPHTFQVLDSCFPHAKFILSVRGSADEWYNSLIRFHTKIVGKGRIPTPKDLKEFPYRQKGWLWDNMRIVYEIDENTLYDAALYKRHYDQHNDAVREYFRNRPDDLLEINLRHACAEQQLGAFLGVADSDGLLPHLNRTV